MFWKLCGIRIADEDEYSVNKGKKSTIRVGNAFQASVPASTNTPNDDANFGEDKLLWDPSMLSEDMIKHYLNSIECQNASEEEKALWLLHRCNYKIEEAITRHQCTLPSITQLETWTEYEQDCFAKGIHKYGKNFNAIQKVIRSKSVEEIIDYYYAWKMKKMRAKSKHLNLQALAKSYTNQK